MSEKRFEKFVADLRAAAAEVTIPEGDPMRLYVSQIRAAAGDVATTYDNVRFDKATIDDMRRWLVRVAACAVRAFMATFSWSPEVLRDRDLCSTKEAIEILTDATGEVYDRRNISAMVKRGELKIEAKKRIEKTGRPVNYFKRSVVLEAASRRVKK